MNGFEQKLVLKQREKALENGVYPNSNPQQSLRH